jgi:hypothetical protein
MSKIETVSGVFFDTIDPNPDDVRLDDIAWATSRTARFAGHTIPVIPYSVAQHSIMVSRELGKLFDPGNKYSDEYSKEILQERFNFLENISYPYKYLSPSAAEGIQLRMEMHGLLHDAAEAYIGDIPSPVKHIAGLKEAIDAVELKILQSIYKSFNIEFPTEEELKFVKFADMVQRTIEAYNFMYSRGKDWGDLPKVSLKKLQAFEGPISAIDAYDQFILEFQYLREGKR